MPSLDLFSPSAARWFARAFGDPTAVQEAAWPAIAKGEHTLVSAPTGTGKTLSAFLVFIDRFKAMARRGELRPELYLIYVSPLKSLAGDIRENLHRPLEGIREEEGAAPEASSEIRAAMRTGDTPQKERRAMTKNPPHILITTPESLYLMLSSPSGQRILRTARAVIIDELHALAGSKRGAHLMLSLARLDRLCPRALQRIGLSATIRPLELAASYLAPEPVTVAAPATDKASELRVASPLPVGGQITAGTVWPDLARRVYEHCEGARSVIAFADGRRSVEKLAYHVNQIAGEGFALTHHGSVSKEQRLEAEHALREGKLRLLCATSSMELGIDVGEIDRVLQIGCPRTVSGTMQRLGRAGHNPGRTSVMCIFPRTEAEGLYCGLTAEVARAGGIEPLRPTNICLDVLAQHLVSMAAVGAYTVDEVMGLLPRAYPFRDISRKDVKLVLSMLAGDFEHGRDIPARPRLLYDRVAGRVEGDAYSRMLAVSAGGTIPDRGLYTVRGEDGTKLGELDEEFVFEARVGDKFLLGAFAWRILSVRKDEVLVAQATPEGAAPPFWKGDSAGRGLQTGIAFGKLMRGLSDSRKQQGPGLLAALRTLGLDEAAAEGARGFLERQLKATGVLPEDRVIIVEHFRDEAGDRQVMVHTLFGRQVNTPLALLAREEARRAGVDMDVFDDDDGFLLFPRDGRALPGDLLRGLAPAGARQTLEAILPATALFGMAFRYNAARALMMGAQSAGRHPLWIQRLRGAEMLDAAISQENHPLIIETRRECMEDYWDMEGTEWVLTQIQRGDIRIHEVFLEAPSPMSLTLRRAAEAALMYEYSPVAAGVQAHTAQALAGLEEARIAPAPAQLVRVSERTRLPENEQQLHSLLMAEGDLLAGEADVPAAWLEKLAREGRVLYIDPGLWIAAEHGEEYAAALEAGDEAAREHIVRRALRYRGFQSAAQIAERYFWPEDSAVSVLAALCARKSVVEADGIYYHESLYARAQRETVKERRRQIKTQPPERYAALLARRTRKSAAPDEQLKAALTSLAGAAFPASLWESVLLPARAPAYRPAMLDAVLAEGGFCWRMEEGGALSFFLREDIDWDAEIPAGGRDSEAEAFVCDALMKRGASFIQNIPSPPGGAPVWDILISLAEKGVVCADSFVPVRHWLKREDVAKTAARQRVGARVMAMNAGRWELMRPIRGRSIEDGIERAFGRAVLLCRETARECGVPWQAALEKLRLWEYTGRVRRGYFIEGLSGAQFLLGTEFESVVFALENPRDEILWLMASDPAQPWGKYLPHRESRGFLNVAGTAVALRGGLPVAALERQGQALRVFDWGSLSEAMGAFTREFAAGRVFAALRRIKLSKYPDMAAETLSAAGFRREMLDYVLYRE